MLAQGKHRQGGRFVRRLQLIWVDGKYGGQLVAWVEKAYGFSLEVVRRPKDAKGWVVLPRRWVVERTFGWLGRYRRLSRDYEGLLLTSEALIYAAMMLLEQGGQSYLLGLLPAGRGCLPGDPGSRPGVRWRNHSRDFLA